MRPATIFPPIQLSNSRANRLVWSEDTVMSLSMYFLLEEKEFLIVSTPFSCMNFENSWVTK